jgi:hypothetical protein
MIPTSPRFEMLDASMIEPLRAMSPAERLAVSNRMWRSARKMIDAVLRAERPDWSEDALRREITRRMSHGAI